MTATHLKRLFANQDVFNSLDRNVAGLTVSEADEQETKSIEGESESNPQTATPSTEDLPALSCAPIDTQVSVTSDEGPTPIAGVMTPARNPLSLPPSPRREYDSDSTISAHPLRESPGLKLLRPPMGDAVESSGMDSDVQPFVSRIPRRSRPTPRSVGVWSEWVNVNVQRRRHGEALPK